MVWFCLLSSLSDCEKNENLVLGLEGRRINEENI